MVKNSTGLLYRKTGPPQMHRGLKGLGYSDN